MLSSAAGMLVLAHVGVDSSYASDVLPALLVVGLGIGLSMATVMQTATLGVRASDTGVASALINTGQQIGGSIGTALLSTLASSAATSYVTSHGPTPAGLTQAAVHGYTTAFLASAAIFATGALVCGALLRPGVAQVDLSAEPVFAH
jgi:hypothetical protein